MENLNKYLMGITHYSGAKEQFEIEATNKAEAVEKAKAYVRTNPHFWGGNYCEHTIKCIKKIPK